MAWRGESWASIVARAAASDPQAKRESDARQDPSALAARAVPWTFAEARLAILEDGIAVGAGMSSVQIAFAQLYHVEPVDPWPSIALGWVDRGEAYETVLTPREPVDDVAELAATVEDLVTVHAARLRAVSRGWLRHATVPWEQVDALPGEREEPPSSGGYRMAPGVVDEVVARRTTATGEASLWTWVWSRLAPVGRRIDPRETVLTKRYVYARTRRGERLRIPIDALRTAWRTASEDAVYVFGRNTELLLVRQPGCTLAAALDERVPTAGRPGPRR